MQNKKRILFKYGGNAMTNPYLQRHIVEKMMWLVEEGHEVIIVHGGGPFIAKMLKQNNIESEFIDGHRKTTKEAMEVVECCLKGLVNAQIVSIINGLGKKAVGISGKDGASVMAEARKHQVLNNGEQSVVDLGFVGNVSSVDTTLVEQLLQNNFIPVLACIAADARGQSYNVNADMFAGHMAGALKVDEFLLLTDVDGLMMDISDSESLIELLSKEEITDLTKKRIISGGMIPKIESCLIALNNGAKSARIINGTNVSNFERYTDSGILKGTQIILE